MGGSKDEVQNYTATVMVHDLFFPFNSLKGQAFVLLAFL